MNILELPDIIVGTGEVDIFTFHKILSSDKALVFKVVATEFPEVIHYETIKRRIVPICLDFENRIYSETDFKEIYPKAKDFGTFGWSFSSISDAMAKYYDLNNEVELKKEQSG